MSAKPTPPALNIEHDHTHLDILFEDLRAVARQAFSASDEPELLEDARAQWATLRDDIGRHFSAEESKVFGPLGATYPDLQPKLAHLMEQHDRLRREIAQMGQLVGEAGGDLVDRNAEFDRRWTEFEALWSDHSSKEWEMLEPLSIQALLSPNVP